MKKIMLILYLATCHLNLSAQTKTISDPSNFILDLKWSMHPRFLPVSFTDETIVVSGYNRITHRYTDDYVSPKGYGVTLRLITKNQGLPENITKYIWEIIGDKYYKKYETQKLCLFAGSSTVNDVSSDCETIELFPYTGSYKIKITAQFTKSGKESSYEKTIVLKDYLIVGMGDSFASGEGSPDKKGDFNILENFFTDTKALWIEPKANRSLKGVFPLLAQKIEDADPHSCVTFLHVGTSGAKTTHGLLFKQDPAWQTVGQIDEVKSYIKNREVDIVLLSIGLNDLGGEGGMSNLIIEAADPLPPEFSGSQTLQTAKEIVQTLVLRYENINNKFKQTIKPKNVFLFQLPTRVFRNERDELTDGCGLFGFLENSDIRILEDLGTRFTGKQKEACLKFGWTYIDGVTSLFKRHGYCAENQSWFVGIKESLSNQNDKNGSVHPNEMGHQKIAELAFPAIWLRSNPIKASVLQPKNASIQQNKN